MVPSDTTVKQQRELAEAMWKGRGPPAASEPPAPGANLRVEAAARLLEGGAKLLDVGCGPGDLAPLAGVRYAEAHGVDISPSAVRRARARGTLAREWDLNRTPLPFADETFDAVALMSVIQYVFDPRDLLADVARMVRTGGQVLVGFPNIRTYWRVYRLAVQGRMPRMSRDPGYDGGTLHYFCRRDIEDLLEQVDLAVVGWVGIHARPRLLERLVPRASQLLPSACAWICAEGLLLARKS